jgi:hypothetical protein
MAQRKSKFDWSLLDRQGLTHLMWMLSDKLVDQEVSSEKFHRVLAQHIKKHLPVKISKKYDKKVDSGYVYLGGTYYSDYDRQREKCLELIFVYNPNDQFINYNKRKYFRFCRLFADTMLHEIMHMRQYRRRNFKNLPDYDSNAEKTEQRQEQSYLGSSDEIDAYSFNIACELMDKFKNDQNLVIQYLNEDQKNKRRKFDCWRMYLKAFNHDHNHIIIKRVKKKVIRYLPHTEIGKPYKNKDWINR